MMDNILAPLKFDHSHQVDRFVKHNVCALCLGSLGVIGAAPSWLGAICRACGTLSTATNTTSRHEADKIKSDRGFAARELREKKPITQAGMDKTIKDLGF